MKNLTCLLLLLLGMVGPCCCWPAKHKANQRRPTTRNDRPIIGVLAQELYDEPFGPQYTTYIAASYVKFIESAGGRVVPIFANSTKSEVDSIFSSINGVLFPGGGAAMVTSGYYKTAKQLYRLAIKANDMGDHFPIWATCLGFEAMHVLRLQDEISVLSSCSAQDMTVPLNFTSDARKSRLLSAATPHLLRILAGQSVTYNHHQSCVEPQMYDKFARLKDFFTVISINKDMNGKTFVSTIEAKNYPFYGVQWHPEKNAYEWTTSEKINHSPDAIAATQYVANFFLSEARKNGHKFDNVEDETKSLIYNYCPRLTIGITHFEEFYLF